MNTAVSFERVTKHYGDFVALDDVSFSVPVGSVFALVGNTGAGKSTALRMLMRLVKPTSGSITVFGGASDHRIGFLPDPPAQYEWMTARSWMELSAGLASIPRPDRDARITHLLHVTGLGEGNTKIEDYPPDERVRLGIAHALIGEPALLVLDEPTSALDPIGHEEVMAMIASLRGRTTVLMATHIPEDAERIADTIGILEEGKLIALGSPAQIRAEAEASAWIEIRLTHGLAAAADAFRKEPWTEQVSVADGMLRLRTSCNADAWRRIPALVTQLGMGLQRLELVEPTLEDVFIDLTEEEDA